MYFRFFTKAMRDLGLIDFDEPAIHLFNQGIILGPDGEKMSKSRGNVINPDEYVDSYGADTFRCYLMFIGPWSEGGPYRPQGIDGIARWLNRVWNLSQEPAPSGPVDEQAVRELERLRHRTIQVVTEDYERFSFNTMLARLMEFTHALGKAHDANNIGAGAWNKALESLVLMMAPAAPHIAEELWMRLGHPYSVHQQSFPTFDESLTKADTITLVVQVNGKVRDKFEAPADIDEATARAMALESSKVRAFTDGHEVVKVLFVPGRLVNIVVR
jgi:leucyl-tRNA synthetase